MYFKREIRLSSQSVVPERSHIAAKMKKTYQLYKYMSHEVLRFVEKCLCRVSLKYPRGLEIQNI